MEHKYLAIIVTALVVLNIFDGSFENPGILDWIKLPLFVLCYVALFVKRKKV